MIRWRCFPGSGAASVRGSPVKPPRNARFSPIQSGFPAIAYTRLLGNATTAAKVGFFLEQQREQLMVEEAHLDALRELCPRQPHYLTRSQPKGCRWVKDWNLMIPTEILERSWGETL